MSDTSDNGNDKDAGETGADGDNEQEIVIERRADKRRRDLEAQDRPVLRRLIGFLILAATAYYALITVRSSWKGRPVTLPPIVLAPVKAPSLNPMGGATQTPHAEVPVQSPAIPIDESALQTIANCTTGVDTLKTLDLKATSLESVFAPIFDPQKVSSAIARKRTVTLQNLRIERPDGSEWRMHSVPEGASGDLRTKLFRVASDGLPEVLPDGALEQALKDPKDLNLFQDPVWSEEKVATFKSLGSTLEDEVHEQWSFRDRIGAQTIRINSIITDLQFFMSGRFMACAQDLRTRKVLCQCRDVRTKPQ